MLQLSKFFLISTLGVVLFCYGYATFRISQDSLIKTDFGKFYNSSQLFLSDQNIYSGYVDLTHEKLQNSSAKHAHLTNLSTPPMMMLMLPFAYLNYGTAFILWTILSFLIILSSLYCLYINTRQDFSFLILMIGFLLFYPTLIALLAGQVTFILLGLLVAAWYFGRESHMPLAGFLLGLAFSLKIFFGLFIVFLFMLHEWKAIAAFCMAVAITALLSIYCFGSPVFFDYHHVFSEIHWYSTNWNVSWYGLMTRLFPILNESNVTVFHNGLIGKLLLWLGYGMITWGMMIFLKPINNTKARWDLGFAYVTTSMLLLSPLGWLYYFPLLVLPFLSIIYWLRYSQIFEMGVMGLLSALFLSSISCAVLLPSQIQDKMTAFTSGTYAVIAGIILLYVNINTYRRLSLSRSEMNILTSKTTWYYGISFMPTLVVWMKIIGQIKF